MDSKKPALARLAHLWCRWMHEEPMWPSHGQYECRKCGRRHLVGWEPALPIPVGTRELPRDTLVDTLVAASESRIQCS